MRSLKQLANDAIEVQDACNINAVARGMIRAMDDLRELHKGQMFGSYELNAHPVTRLWAHKLADLSNMADTGSELYGHAYMACLEWRNVENAVEVAE
jgi:hypothetical protein